MYANVMTATTGIPASTGSAVAATMNPHSEAKYVPEAIRNTMSPVIAATKSAVIAEEAV